MRLTRGNKRGKILHLKMAMRPTQRDQISQLVFLTKIEKKQVIKMKHKIRQYINKS
jgi:hypothetical protein